jgi:hypothetical protein
MYISLHAAIFWNCLFCLVEYTEERCEDAIGVMRSRKSKNSIQHNGQQKKELKDKQRSTNTTQKIKNITNPAISRGNLMCSGKVAILSPLQLIAMK